MYIGVARDVLGDGVDVFVKSFPWAMPCCGWCQGCGVLDKPPLTKSHYSIGSPVLHLEDSWSVWTTVYMSQAQNPT